MKINLLGISNAPNATGDGSNKPTISNNEANIDEFDMFAQSRNVTYETSKKS